MQILSALQKMKAAPITYKSRVRDYVCDAQQVFSGCLLLFYALHMGIRNLITCEQFQIPSTAIALSALQIILSLLSFILFRSYFKVHKKYTLIAAYCNILQVLLLLELQYFLHDEYITFVVIMCILLSASLTIIGNIRLFFVIVMMIFALDMAITLMINGEFQYIHQAYLYIVDNFFLVVTAVGMNLFCCRFNYQSFETSEKITYLSQRDGLTALLNRRTFERSVLQHCFDNTPCAMILLDLDNFKLLNDALGHHKGDDCLRVVAYELKKLFRNTDYIGRLGGDEFVIFLPNCTSTDCITERANMMLKNIPQKYSYEKGDIYVTCSIGIAISTSNNSNLYEQLYLAADSAMYRSKKNGKNSISIVNINDPSGIQS